jgi:hypothetical protein
MCNPQTENTRHFRSYIVYALIFLAPLVVPAPARSGQMEIYFTTFAGGVNVNATSVSYDPVSNNVSIGPIAGIASTPGADGIAFTSDHSLAVGGQSLNVYKVDPFGSPPGTFTGQSSPTFSEHVMVAPDGTIYTSGEPGNPSSFNSTLSAPGSAHAIVGSEVGSGITSLSWTGSDPLHAFYTSSGETGGGNFGQIDLTNPSAYSTTRLLTGLPAAHGMIFDSGSGTLILVGAGHITQIDPANPSAILSDLNLSGQGFNFNSVVVAAGVLFVASNDGTVVVDDMSHTGLVGSPNNFVGSFFLAPNLDSIATPPVPEPGSLVLLGVGGGVLIIYLQRRRRPERKRGHESFAIPS